MIPKVILIAIVIIALSILAECQETLCERHLRLPVGESTGPDLLALSLGSYQLASNGSITYHVTLSLQGYHNTTKMMIA